MNQPNKGHPPGETAYQANPDYLYRALAGEHILVPTGPAARQFNGLVTLNETGAFLWRLLERRRTRDELVAALAREYEATEVQVGGDVDGFLALAARRGLIRQG